jgi:hypothetical protein
MKSNAMSTEAEMTRTERRYYEARIAQLRAEQARETRAAARKELGVTIATLQARMAR